MSFARLRAADWIALVAAFLLLFTMAMDWYSTARGEEAREIQQNVEQLPPQADERENALEDARTAAEAQEVNAWQAEGTIDRVILIGLLGTVALAILAAFLRAAGKAFSPPLTPSGLVALVGGATALFVLYRVIQEPGFDEITVIKAGAPLSLLVLGAIALAGASALRAEETTEPEPEPEPAT